jgi:microcystin degradation protein MlrC
VGLRIGIAGVFHETNTYAPRHTALDAFIVLRGGEIITYSQDTKTYLGGLMDACVSSGFEAVPLLYAEATPSGTIEQSAYLTLRDELASMVAEANLDGLLLALHGAGVAEGADNIEEDLCGLLRERCGPSFPIIATLDLHGNLNPLLGRLCSALFPVRYNPHTDQHERGVEAVRCMASILVDGVQWETAIVSLPMLIPPVPTSLPVFKELEAVCDPIEDRDDVACARIMHGFPYADVPHCGSSVCVVARAGAGAAALAKRVAEALWQRRTRIKVDCLPPAEAVAEAMRDGQPMVVINEFSDNTGAGSPGDGTHLLRALIESGAAACFSHMFDPETVRQAAAAGVGATIEVRMGARFGPLHGEPIVASAEVLGINSGLYNVKSPMGTGEIIDLGLLATLRIAKVVIIVSSGRRQTLDDGPFIKAGIDISQFPIVALKSSQHFRAYFTGRASRIVTADAPGLSPVTVSHLPRPRLARKTWPIHEDAAAT